MKLNEDINAGAFVAYHRTSLNKMGGDINNVKNGFIPGSGEMYGNGTYCTYELNQQLKDSMRKIYGNIIIEFKIPSNGKFLILDYDQAKKVYGNRYTFLEQLKQIMGGYFNKFYRKNYDLINIIIKEIDNKKYTNKLCEKIIWGSDGLIEHIDGIVFTGKSDGKVIVVYNTNIVKPIRYTLDDGETWKSLVDKTSYGIGKTNILQNKLLNNIKNVVINDKFLTNDEKLNYVSHIIKNGDVDSEFLLNDLLFSWCSSELKMVYFKKVIDDNYALTTKQFKWYPYEFKLIYAKKRQLTYGQFKICDNNLKLKYIEKPYVFLSEDMVELLSNNLKLIYKEKKLSERKKLNENYHVSFDSRVWVSKLVEMINKMDETKFRIDGRKFPEEYSKFPVDYFYINGDNGVTEYDEHKSGYNKDGLYCVYLSLDRYNRETGINHELHHAYEDYQRISKNKKRTSETKEVKELFSKDGYNVILGKEPKVGYFRFVLYFLYMSTKVESNAYIQNIYDGGSFSYQIYKQFKEMLNINFNRYKNGNTNEYWLELKKLDIPIVSKFNDYIEFLTWCERKIQYRAGLFLKKVNKINYIKKHPINEEIKLDIKVGDTLLGGKFKNKKIVVKEIGKNDKGEITINGKTLLRYRIIKNKLNENYRHIPDDEIIL